MTVSGVQLVSDEGNEPTVGDDMEITRNLTSLTSGQTVDKAWFTVKASKDDSDVDAKLQLVISTASTAAGQITDDGTGDTDATIKFTPTPSDFSEIVPETLYYFDIQVLLSDGIIKTLESGTIKWLEEVTKATS